MSKKRWYRVEVEFKVSGIVFVKEIDKIMAKELRKKILVLLLTIITQQIPM